MDIDLKGKMFLFNAFRFQRKELNSRFHPVSSDMTLQEAVQELLGAPEQERSGAAADENKIRATSAHSKKPLNHSENVGNRLLWEFTWMPS